MKITTKDLAEICGVSRATVARALHGNGRISEETKRRILETAKAYDYEPDLVARSLVSGRSTMIGVIIVDLGNQYYSKIVDAIAKRVLQDGYILNITVHGDDKEMEKKLIRTLVGHHVDGLIVSPINKGEHFYRMMERVGVPYCVLGLDEFEGCPGVGLDERKAGLDAAEYIAKKGYRKLLFVAPPFYDSDGVPNMGHYKRWDGVQEVGCRYGMACSMITQVKPENYLPLVLDYIKSCGTERPAILCSGAMFAVKVLGYLRREGYAAPDDYGIMTFDNLDEFGELHPRLPCVDNHVEKIGYAAGDLLMHLIQGEETDAREMIPHDILEGDTL